MNGRKITPEQIQELHHYRMKFKEAQEKLREAKDKFEAENKSLFDSYKEAKLNMENEEKEIKNLAEIHYTLTDDKEAGPGIKVKMFKSIEYDQKQALNWAIEHKICLALDKKAFEHLVRSSPLDFVTVRNEPKATIAKDLSKYIAGEE